MTSKLKKIKTCGSVLTFFYIAVFYSCERFEPEREARIETGTVSGITSSSCIASGTIIDVGKDIISEYGHCWSEEINPTVEDERNIFYNKNSAGRFVGNVSGLEPNTRYYIRAYAMNGNGTIYGGSRDFTTLSGEVVSDIDGNIYNMVAIGTQVWMKENLKTTKFNTGDLIETTNPATLNVSGETNPVYQWVYNGNEENVALYGRLYTWFTVTDIRKLCPTGWHIPSKEEWTILMDYLGGAGVAGNKLRETGTEHWESPNTGASNEAGFTALPGGTRQLNGQFWGLRINGGWWSSTENTADDAWYIFIPNNSTSVFDQIYENKKISNSVRCLKD